MRRHLPRARRRRRPLAQTDHMGADEAGAPPTRSRRQSTTPFGPMKSTARAALLELIDAAALDAEEDQPSRADADGVCAARTRACHATFLEASKGRRSQKSTVDSDAFSNSMSPSGEMIDRNGPRPRRSYRSRARRPHESQAPWRAPRGLAAPRAHHGSSSS